MLWHRHQRRSAARDIGRSLGIHVDRRLLVLTDQRLLLWQLGKRALGEFRGAVDRSRIASVSAPTVGEGGRTCILRMTSCETATLRVIGEAADKLAAALGPDVSA